MSPRAAWRLERLGFTEVYDYAAGKVDWMAAGLPTEGNGTHPPRVLERNVERLRRVLERALQIAVVVQVPDEVLGSVVKPLGQQDAHVPREVLG